MQTFKQFLLERRSRAMGIDDAKTWMANNAMDYLDNGVFLYRGIQGEPSKTITYANTDEGNPRKSIGGMSNYYTLWMTHHPKWEDKPRRERSFICSSSPSDAGTWGRLHIVIPSDGSVIGSVGADDIWNKMVKSDMSVAAFTNATREILKAFTSSEDATNPDMTFTQLTKMLKSVQLADILEKQGKSYMLISGMVNLIKQHYDDTLYDLWDIIFDPKNFEFFTPGDLELKDDGEFWVDGSALYIPVTKSLSDEDMDALIAWAEDNSPKLAKELIKHWK